MSKTILLTGSTDGIGFETAKLLAKDGHTLLIHGRSNEKLEATKKELLEINSNLNVETFIADFSSIDEVKQMSNNILEKNIKLDIIINNAGVFLVDDSQVITKDNLDVRFSVNTVAPYILTKKLLPLLSEDGRIVNVSSAAQSTIDFDALENKKALSHSDAYAQSKLAIIMWSIEMAENEAKDKMVVSINPKSFLGSKMVREAYGKKGFDIGLGADILYRASLSNEFSNANGKYYDNDIEMFSAPHPDANNKPDTTKLINFMKKFL